MCLVALDAQRMPPEFPVKLYYPRADGTLKILSAKDQKELDGLMKIGWKKVE